MKSDIKALFKPKDSDKVIELNSIVLALVNGFPDIEMIVLFGSYATGKWVEDIQRIGGNEYGYNSDFDLLIILHTNSKANSSLYTARFDQVIRSLKLSTPVGAIYHGIDFVNRQIIEGSYFFHEIVEHGYMLYNSNRHTLNPVKALDIIELKAKAQKDFEYWTRKADQALTKYELCMQLSFMEEAAFELHQATERYYAAVRLVFTGYKPKTHDIGELEVYINNLDLRFAKVFHRESEAQENYFQLLRRAYVDARYNVNYVISKEELEYIYNRVKTLQSLTKKVCTNKIHELVGKI